MVRPSQNDYSITPASIWLAAAKCYSNPVARARASSISFAPKNEMMTIMIRVVSSRTIARSESLVVLPNGPIWSAKTGSPAILISPRPMPE
ncbi:MAG: hypothetical protein GXY83_25900 [Rhodopirellula sp.]|nr:hypothetical protein [Rhodopirellula sp.]